MSNMVALGSYGASVMTGCRNGVASKSKAIVIMYFQSTASRTYSVVFSLAYGNAADEVDNLKGGAHSNHYRMQECTSSRPHPTTHHKPLTANDIHTIL